MRRIALALLPLLVAGTTNAPAVKKTATKTAVAKAPAKKGAVKKTASKE